MAGVQGHAQQGAQQQQQQNGDIAKEIAKGAQEAGEALAKELAKNIAAPEPAGDPEVMVAFTLGWQMSELYNPAKHPARDAVPETDLPGLSELGAKEHAELGLDQLAVGLRKLEHTIDSSGLPQPSPTDAKDALRAASAPNADYKKALFELHVDLLTTLTAAHFKLGKAYGLGRALADTTRLPKDLPSLQEELDPPRVTNLLNWISDLTSLFPPHAGQVVHDSLEKWRDWAKDAAPDDAAAKKAVSLLRRQGQRWRSLLSGEKSATDALKLVDYVNAGELALSNASTLALGFLGRFKLAVGIAAVLFVGGLALVIWDPTGGSVAGGLAGILASLGLTWKGVGASLGSTAAKMERPVWQGALDSEIAASISLLPNTESAAKYVPPKPPQGMGEAAA